MLHKQLCTIVDSFIRLFFDCAKLRLIQMQGTVTIRVTMTASVTSQSQEILTGSNKYKGTDGGFCNNVVYPETW